MIHKKIDFLKKSSKILYPLSKPPPKFGKILVIGGSLDKGFYGKYSYDYWCDSKLLFDSDKQFTMK